MSALEKAQGGSAPSPPPRKKRRAVFIMRHGEREDYAWGTGAELAAGAQPAMGHAPDGDEHLRGLRGAGGGGALRAAGLAARAARAREPAAALRPDRERRGEALGVERLCVGVALAETMNEDWYRSWAVRGDSTWGGPQACRQGVPVARRPCRRLGPRAARRRRRSRPCSASTATRTWWWRR